MPPSCDGIVHEANIPWVLTAQCCCLAGHAGGINCLDISPDGRSLVAVGLNSYSKQLVILWSIAGLCDGHKVNTPTASNTSSLLTQYRLLACLLACLLISWLVG